MFSRKNAYEASDQSKGQNLDEMSRKLAVDLRKNVRRLEMLPHHTKACELVRLRTGPAPQRASTVPFRRPSGPSKEWRSHAPHT